MTFVKRLDLIILCESIKMTQESRSKKQQINSAKFIAHLTATARVYNSSKKHQEVLGSVEVLLESHFWPSTPPLNHCSSTPAVTSLPHPHSQSPLQQGWGTTQVMINPTLHNTNSMHSKGSAVQALIGPGPGTATRQQTSVQSSLSSCPVLPLALRNVRIQSCLPHAPTGPGPSGGNQW